MMIRLATLDDVAGIVKLHTAGEEPAGNLYRRYSMGGPWMSAETLAIHINNLLLDNQLVAVAELNGEIVGEIEVLLSEEPIKGKLMPIAHIDVIEVHPDYRGRGIGRALIEFVEEIAGERGARLLTVQPDDAARGFYGRLGFSVALFSGTIVRVPTGGAGRTEITEFGWEDVKNLELVAGRFQSSYSMFFSAFKDNIAGIHHTVESGRSGASYYALRNLPGRGGLALLLWGRLEDVRPVLERAKVLGCERVLTVLPNGVESFGVQKVREVEIIGKSLT
ncbi:GNAT family N-acetyltransferase [Thermococcus aciditolerans]|uniref:GNAT family N-acetyltransferase n=1 Tax=Thermococcus aciditolerans TaxID=2598455 RepID=A0A5C0SNM9_9EURY|nr:GNAT family N-acetyltransferase [Thermococcus aciditolerans]QEK14479.1 GNAT family N-acetyltransferase [Thermococcus aciditolerans]